MSRGRALMMPRPFLKWVGGKGQLLETLDARVGEHARKGRYHEPFVGGGALFFHLHRNGRLGQKRAYLSDANLELVNAYQMVQLQVEPLIELLLAHQAAHSGAYYYAMRAAIPADPIEQAARTVYLNKTCFNGLYRVNSRGIFNVPMGRYKAPKVCDPENLRAVSKALKSAVIEHRAYADVLKRVKPGDFVYFDPPYAPVSATSNFTGYDRNMFRAEDQVALRDVFGSLGRHQVRALLSNSSAPEILELYRKFTLETLQANRNVNSRADRRGQVTEVLVRNYRDDGSLLD